MGHNCWVCLSPCVSLLLAHMFWRWVLVISCRDDADMGRRGPWAWVKKAPHLLAVHVSAACTGTCMCLRLGPHKVVWSPVWG